jgi:lipopolysaccharide biosynthesis glycosyltransferase
MKIALATVLNDSYLAGYLLTVNSMIRNSPNFDYDIIILDWGELSDDSKNVIKKLYSKVFFKKVDKKLYENHTFDEIHRKWTYNCNYRFDVFTLTDYDKVIFFDCDIIFQNDINELLILNYDFAACPLDRDRVKQTDSEFCFDAGLMVIGKKFLNERVRDELVEEGNKPPPVIDGFKAEGWLSDEPILNNYFKNYVFLLPKKYNTVASEITDETYKDQLNIQYTGDKKPWNSDILEERLSRFTIEQIKKDDKRFLFSIRFKRILLPINREIDFLKEKDIDVKKYIKTK